MLAASPSAPRGPLLVVAAAIRDPRGRWLLQQRRPGKHHAGLWEFPGGKVEQGEAPRAALCREVAEELGLTLDPAALRPLGFAEDAGESAGSALVLLLFGAESEHCGTAAGREGQSWGWFARADLAALALAPLDRALIAVLPAERR